MRIPIASDGYRFIIPLVIITIALTLSPLIWLAGVSGLLLLEFGIHSDAKPEW